MNITQLSKEEKKIMIHGIAIGCPFNERILSCCALKIENMSYEERIKYINTLSDEELFKLYNRHSKCLEKREGIKLWKSLSQI